MGVSRPEVIQKKLTAKRKNPMKRLYLTSKKNIKASSWKSWDCAKSTINGMTPDGKGRIKLEYTVPSRGLIGFRGLFLTLTSGTGIMTSIFDHYGAIKTGGVADRKNGC